jgi:hypothetical protein
LVLGVRAQALGATRSGSCDHGTVAADAAPKPRSIGTAVNATLRYVTGNIEYISLELEGV